MHSLLEAYLEQVAAHLSALPVKRRNEELRKMRQHLLNAVTVNRELGQSEEDAAQSAVLQFGTPADLGHNLVWVWRREERSNKCSFWGAAALTLALTFWPNFPSRVVHLALSEPFLASQTHPWQAELWVVLLLMASYFLCGLACNAVFPRRGLAGTAVAEIGLMLLFFSVNFITLLRDFPGNPAFTSLLTLEWLCPTMAIFGAWVGSRRRTPRAERSRLTPG